MEARSDLVPADLRAGRSAKEARALTQRLVGHAGGLLCAWADVVAATQQFVETLAPDAAGRQVTVKPLGEMSVLDCVSGMCMTHGYRHLGEIEFAKGLVAARGGSTI
jgi:hypothetical protein